MTATRVKICGLTNADDVTTAVAAGADALGYIVDVPVDTPREISAHDAATLVADTPPFVTNVLVTMAESPAAVATLAEMTGVDAVQVHGHLATERIQELGATIDVPTIAGLDPTTDDVDAVTPHADAILLDSTDDSGAGGTGTTHDWDHAATIVEDLDTPVILAGGLTPDTVAAAVEATSPFAVDVATGVEATGGQKDPDAVHAFVDAATTGAPS